MLKAVLLDVDFTLFRPGPELGPDGYARVGARHGLELDGSRYEEARLGALADLQRHPELVHDEDGYKHIRYQQLTALLIEAVKEQDATVRALSAEVGALSTTRQGG